MQLSYESICAQTISVHSSTKVHTLPIHPNTSFEFSSMEASIDVFSGQKKGHVYSRYGNPTVEAVAYKIAQLETFGSNKTAKAYLLASGMAAISTLILSVCKSGDQILISRDLYGGSLELMDKIMLPLGIGFELVDLSDLNQVERELKSNNYQLLFFETPTNPLVKCYDIKQIVALCQKYHCKTALDNTFSTSLIQRPLLMGVDTVVYSATKYLNGHGNCTIGVVLSLDIEFMENQFWTCLKLTGGICSPFEAWNLNNGLKTLSLRMNKHSKNAKALADFLESSKHVKKVYYPGLSSHDSHEVAKTQMGQYGGMLSFELDTNIRGIINFIDALQLISNAPTLGDTDSLLLHPFSSSHVNVDPEIRRQSGITEQLLRISVGIESVEDIFNDIGNAFEEL